MSERSKHIDKLYQDKLGGYTEQPPASVWDAIELRLEDDDDKKGGFRDDDGHGGGRPRFPLRWWWVLFALLLFVGTAVGVNKLITRQTIEEEKVSVAPYQKNNEHTGKTAAVAPSKEASDDNTTDETQGHHTTKGGNSRPQKAITEIKANDNKTKDETHSSKTKKANSFTPNKKTVANNNATAKQEKKTQNNVAQNVTTHVKPKLVTTIPQTDKQEEATKSTEAKTVEEASTNDEEQIEEVVKQEEQEATEEEVAVVETEAKVIEAEEVAQEEAKDIASTNDEEQSQEVEQETTDEEVTVVEESKAKTIKTETATQEQTKEEDVAVTPAQTKKQETTTESATEETETYNELGYLSGKNKKNKQKKARKKKPKQKDEDDYEYDEDGLNEYNTLTPKPPKPRRWELGIKAGYQYGFNNDAKVDMVVFSPYLQYMVVPHVSLLFQPSYLTGNAKVNIKPDELYYNVSSTSFDSTIVIRNGDSLVQIPDTMVTTMIYNKVYDSTHVSYELKQKSMWDVELPLMLQYDISPQFTIYGGVSLTFSKVLSYQQLRTDHTGLSLTDTVIDRQTFFVSWDPKPQPPTPQDPATYFHANAGSHISNFKPLAGGNTQRSFSNFGVMFGFRSTIAEKYMIDVLMKKSFVNTSVITDPQLQKLYNQPYLRVTLGYKLYK